VTQFRKVGNPVIIGITSKVNDKFINKNKTAKAKTKGLQRRVRSTIRMSHN